MKKLLILLLALVTALSCSVGLVGCKEESGDLTQAEVSAIYKQAAKSVWAMLGKEDPTASVSSLSVEIPDYTEEETSESMKEGHKYNLNVMTLYVNFIGDLYANKDFVYTDKVVTFTATATSYGQEQTLTMSVTADIDKENDKIYSEYVLGDDTMGYLYMLMDIGYDFEQKVATSFRLVYYNVYDQDGETVRFLNDQKYTADGRCYIGYLTDDYQTALTAFEADFAQRKANGVVLTATFDEEFQTLQDLSASLMSGGGY